MKNIAWMIFCNLVWAGGRQGSYSLRLLQPLVIGSYSLLFRLLQPLGLLQPMKLLQLRRLLQPGSCSLWSSYSSWHSYSAFFGPSCPPHTGLIWKYLAFPWLSQYFLLKKWHATCHVYEHSAKMSKPPNKLKNVFKHILSLLSICRMLKKTQINMLIDMLN